MSDLQALGALPADTSLADAASAMSLGGRYLWTEPMSIDDWISVPDNPRQRNTERRAQAALKWLGQPSPTHCRVAMAVLNDGRRFKLDGHTRALLWYRRQAPEPQQLIVDVYLCPNIERVKTLYDELDSVNAVKTPADAVTGAYREHDLQLSNRFLAGGGLKSGLKASYRACVSTCGDFDINHAVGLFKPELLALDRTEAAARWFKSGLVAAAVITLAASKGGALRFWAAYAAGEGMKCEGRMDAVEALRDRVLRIRDDKRLPSGGAYVAILMQYGITAYVGFEKGHEYSARNGLMLSKSDKVVTPIIQDASNALRFRLQSSPSGD